MAEPDLNKLLQILIENQLDFVIIGGFAGVLHGSTMVTRDLDLCMSMDDLIKSKQVLGRPKDVRMIEELKHIAKKSHE